MPRHYTRLDIRLEYYFFAVKKYTGFTSEADSIQDEAKRFGIGGRASTCGSINSRVFHQR